MNNEERIIELLTDIKALLGGKDNKIVKKVAVPVGGLERFDEFWSVYPKKADKKEVKRKWAARKLDDMADALIADVGIRVAKDSQWLSGYAPNPLTYINGDKWKDDIQTAVQTAVKVNPADYIIPQDWKERGLQIGLKPDEGEKYIDFRKRVETMSLFR